MINKLDLYLSKMREGFDMPYISAPLPSGKLGVVDNVNLRFKMPEEVILLNKEPMPNGLIEDNFLNYDPAMFSQPFESCIYFPLSLDPFKITLPMEKNDCIFFAGLASIEVAPSEFKFFSIGSTHNSIDNSLSQLPMLMMVPDELAGKIIYHYLKDMNKMSMGVEKVRFKYKAKTSSGKKNYRLNKIIHIGPRKNYETNPETQHRDIDWSHSWMVRGHWRKIDGIGKDRAGNYGVKGFTWVSAHAKGPEEKELIRKIRIVK